MNDGRIHGNGPGEEEEQSMNTERKVFSRLWGSRLVVEGLVIVVSILLAFALDAAWDDRQERLRRDEYLLVLEDEFQSAADEMAEQIQDHERQIAEMEILIDQLDRGAEFTVDAFWSVFSLYYFGPAHPVFMDLANASSVDVLELSTLRYSLFRYGRQKEFLENLHQRETVFWQEIMEPYVVSRFDYRFGYPAGDENEETVRRISAEEPDFHNDAYLRNLLVRRRGTIRSQLRVDHDIAAAIQEILAEIESYRASD
jgi:hypothetical protein